LSHEPLLSWLREVFLTAYIPLVVQRTIHVSALYSVHYFEYTSHYKFPGEAHDFWEILYVDKGNVRVTADDRSYNLTRGQLIFHAPGEFHALSADGVAAPNLVVVSFQCDSPAMEFFRQRVTFAGAPERLLLARIVEESRSAFSTPMDDPATTTLTRRPDAPVGCEQLAASALEELLIRLLRQDIPSENTPPTQDLLNSDVLDSIVSYLEQRLDRPLTVDQICRDNMIGRSQLQKLFHGQTGGGVMEYFSRMKIRAARQMIREGRLNFTQIAEALGFQSVHYFSRRFRSICGMSPSEYADSVKMLSDSHLP